MQPITTMYYTIKLRYLFILAINYHYNDGQDIIYIVNNLMKTIREKKRMHIHFMFIEHK